MKQATLTLTSIFAAVLVFGYLLAGCASSSVPSDGVPTSLLTEEQATEMLENALNAYNDGLDQFAQVERFYLADASRQQQTGDVGDLGRRVKGEALRPRLTDRAARLDRGAFQPAPDRAPVPYAEQAHRVAAGVAHQQSQGDGKEEQLRIRCLADYLVRDRGTDGGGAGSLADPLAGPCGAVGEGSGADASQSIVSATAA